MKQFYVVVTDDSTGDVVERIGPMGERKAEKVFDALMRQINHAAYSVRIQTKQERAA